MNRRRGFSVTELIISLAVFSLLVVVLGASLTFTQSLVRRVHGQADNDMQLKRAATALQRDLSQASFFESAAAPGLTLSGARMGDALWFLSPRDTAQQPHRKLNGTPFWSCNVLYYLTVPSNHDAVFGQSCSFAADANGYDQNCPHKLLIRLEMDEATATNYADEDSEEELLAAPTSYLLQPIGLNAGGLVSGSIRSAKIIANNLLTLRVRNPGVDARHSIEIQLQAVALEAARKKLAVGTTPLANSAFTTEWRWTVRPGIP